MKKHIPMSLREAKAQGFSEFDIIIVSGDSFIDHSSFGTAIIARILESKGFKVGIIAQPNWKKLDDFKKLGKPKLFFGITSGNMDSMVANYTPLKKKRDKDYYSPDGIIGLRPDRATIVYSHKIREAYKDVPIVLGGVEATVRRFVHYDFVSNNIRKPILFDSRADLLIHGMGEYTIVKVAEELRDGKKIEELTDLRGTCYRTKVIPENSIKMPSFEEIEKDKVEFGKAHLLIERNANPFTGKALVQGFQDQLIVSNPNVLPLTTEELDYIYELPYTREQHPSYKQKIPALNTVINSVQVHRGCYGSCSFCSIPLVQGKTIQNRSIESVLREVEEIKKSKNFRGVINDLSGPSANMYGTKCKNKQVCNNNCLYTEKCSKLDFDDSELIKLYRAVRSVKGVRKVTIRSGVRLDLVMDQKKYFEELLNYHVSGQLKIAPEHVSESVLSLMKKSDQKTFEGFLTFFEKTKRKIRKELYLVPYFISAHPGCSLREMADLMEFLIDNDLPVKQTQLFTPTPMTASTAMYWSETNIYTGKKIFVPYTFNEKKLQKSMLHFKDPDFKFKAIKALRKLNRNDLISKISGRY